MPSYCLPLLVLLLMCGVWLGVEAAISEDAVLLTLSGDLEMTASWTDSPRSGSTYNVYILTNFRDPPSSAVHVKNGLTFDAGLTQMSYAITAANFNEFTPIGATVGNFPGFEHGELYRLYIEYYDASGAQLNTGVELSEFATPMIKAAAPRNLTDCGLFGTHEPCDSIPYASGTIHSFRVYWESPLSRGYGSYVPPDSHQIEYYKLQISDTISFEQVRAEERCNWGTSWHDFFTRVDIENSSPPSFYYIPSIELHNFCVFDAKIATFQNVKRYWSSFAINQDIYVRVAAGTVIGDGAWSAPIAVRPSNIWFQLWSNMQHMGISFDEFVMQTCALIPHARWEPWTPHIPGTQKPMATHCGCVDGYTEKWSSFDQTLWNNPGGPRTYATHAPQMHCLPCG